MKNDIDLYINSVYCGFYPVEKIYEYMREYHEKALKFAENIEWDEIIIYAIFGYDSQNSGLVSADFMILRMPYSQYVNLYYKLSKDCRLFFTRCR